MRRTYKNTRVKNSDNSRNPIEQRSKHEAISAELETLPVYLQNHAH
jgi:hypothetical protein